MNCGQELRAGDRQLGVAFHPASAHILNDGRGGGRADPAGGRGAQRRGLEEALKMFVDARLLVRCVSV